MYVCVSVCVLGNQKPSLKAVAHAQPGLTCCCCCCSCCKLCGFASGLMNCSMTREWIAREGREGRCSVGVAEISSKVPVTNWHCLCMHDSTKDFDKSQTRGIHCVCVIQQVKRQLQAPGNAFQITLLGTTIGVEEYSEAKLR